MTEACFPGPLCSVGAEVLGPAHVHVRVLLLYSQLLLLPHSNSSNTSRGRPGARHPPLRGDSATPGRLPAGLRRRLDHDTQARCSRPARAFLPGPFALAQPASPAAAPGTGSSPEEEVRLDSLGGWCLRYTGAATCRGLLWPSRASRSKRVRLAGRPTHLPSTRSVRGGSSNARAMCDGRWCWRASGRSAPLVVAGTSLSRGRAPAYAS